MLNKPRGYVTTLSDERGRPTAAELVADCGTRVYPVGRLDLDSEGLLLFTNDGAWMQRILHPSHEIEKTYEVTVAGAVENAAAELAAVRSVDGEPIALTPKEYDILYYLMQHPGKVYIALAQHLINGVAAQDGDIQLSGYADRRHQQAAHHKGAVRTDLVQHPVQGGLALLRGQLVFCLCTHASASPFLNWLS